MATSLAERTAQRLIDRAQWDACPVVAGFDGFVDTIIHVVDKRTSPSEYVRLAAMKDFARRIEKAAGIGANFEFVTQIVKLGGNGPIFAAALATAGVPMTYIGCLGHPQVHPAFQGLAQIATIHSLSEPGYTDAIEFDDGKLMCGKMEGLAGVRWDSISGALPGTELVATFERARLVAMMNWTMLVHMTDIFENFLTAVAPHLGGPKRWIFFDLADPARRTADDLRHGLNAISRFQEHFRVILGLNLHEAQQVGAVLGLDHRGEDEVAVTELACSIRAAMEVGNVVVHPRAFAAAAEVGGSACVPGPVAVHPKITTGAGDHFNAGFCLGRLAGGSLEESLQAGVATSGYYVRNARSPNARELAAFLRAECAR